MLNAKRNKTEMLAAGIWNPIHVTDEAKAGAHIAAVPYMVLVQMEKYSLTDAGIERLL